MARNTKRVQMDFAALCGYQNEIIWDLLNQEQADILKDKIRSLISDPSNYGERMRTTLFKSVWAQRKYTNRNLLFSIFYVLVTDTETRAAALSSTKFSCHPVFRMRKCTSRSNSSNCCMIYVDECGRVYQNWSDYLRNNVLPQGIFVAPRFGVYTFDGTDIDLFIGYTAASLPAAKAIQKADKAFALGGLASAGIAIASICSLPVAAPLLAIGTTVGLVSAGYSTLRSGSTLLDRKEHEQSISLDDRQARSNWIGFAGGAVGFGASAATGALARSAAAGKNVSKITTVMVNGMNISSCVFAGSGVANSVLEMILKQEDDEEITAMDVLQLATSLAMFTHSVKNFRSAQSIVREAQNGRIQSYREGLSNRQRKMFDKMAKETMRIRGADHGRIDVIRSVREMPSKQYLNDLHKINRQLNEQKVRPAFGGADKPVVLNNDVAVDTGVLRNSVQHKVGPDVLSQVKQPIPVGSVAKGIPAKSSSMESGFQNIKNSVQKKTTSVIEDINYSQIVLYSGNILTCIELGHTLIKCINNPEIFKNSVQALAKELVDKCFRYVMGLAASFIERQLFGINIIIPAEHLIQALHEIMKSFKIKTQKYIESKVDDIIKWLRSFFTSKEYLHKFKEMESIMETAEITFKQITLYSGKVIRFAELGHSVLEHIKNADEVLNISRELPDEVFYAVVDLAKEFIDGKLKEIEKAIQMKIPSETVMRKITDNTKQYENTSGEFIKSQRATILNSLGLFFSSEEFRKNFMQEALKDKFKKTVVLNNDVAVDTGVLRNRVCGINIIPAEHLIQALHEIIKSFIIKTQKYIESKVDDIINWLRSFFTSKEYLETAEITFKQITLYSGKVIRFAELGHSVLEHIKNADEVLNISRELPDEVFYAVVDMAKEFIDGKLKEIEKAIQMKIPSETVMRKITDNTKQYENTSGEFIKSQRATILNSLGLFFSSEEFRKNFMQEALKDKFFLFHCSRQFFDLIFDIDDFKEIIESMYTTFDNDTFRLLLKLANAFVENKLPEIRDLLKITISTEDVLHKILVRCLKNRTDVISTALEKDFGKMLILLENYYRSINPNSNYDMLKICEICKGAYAICVV